MNAAISWALALAALAVGYFSYGWPGLVLGVTVVAFSLLLQFSRTLRLMRATAQRPIGSVASALMLQSKLQRGLRLADLMKLAGSFGTQVAATPAAGPAPDTEVYVWQDAGGDALHATLVAGKLQSWELRRAADAGAAEPSA